MLKVKTSKATRLYQGDIIKDVEYIEYVKEESGKLELSKIIFPYIIVLTQDCDLEWDYKSRSRSEVKGNQNKWLISILVAPIYNSDHFFAGEHLSDLNMIMSPIKESATKGQNVKKNEDFRYHYLNFPEHIDIVNSVIDFKHYFSVNIHYLRELKRTNFVCRISELYREDINLRFANFLARIGLPNN